MYQLRQICIKNGIFVFIRDLGARRPKHLKHTFNASACWVNEGEPALNAQTHEWVSAEKDLLETPEPSGLRTVSDHQALDALNYRVIGKGQAVVNLARLVAKNAFTLRTLASWVNRVWLIAK